MHPRLSQKLLLEHRPSRHDPGPDGFTPLHRAAFDGDVHLVWRLLAAGAAVDARSTHPGGCTGATPLHLAVAAGSREVVDLLLSVGAHPGATDDAGYTAIHLAAERGDLPVVRLLLRAGADVMALIGETTPMDLARRGRHAQVAGLLRQMGAR
jgi:ankyrin repeat protein